MDGNLTEFERWSLDFINKRGMKTALGLFGLGALMSMARASMPEQMGPTEIEEFTAAVRAVAEALDVSSQEIKQYLDLTAAAAVRGEDGDRAGKIAALHALDQAERTVGG